MRFVMLIMLLSGCNLMTPLNSSETLVPPTPQDLNSVPTVGYLDMPYLGGDAGSVAVESGATIPVAWVEFPAGAARYAFFQTTDDGTQLIADDFDASDGVEVLWTVPEDFVGSLRAEAYDQNSTIIGVAFSPESVGAATIPPTPAVEELFEGAPPAQECIAANVSPGWASIYDSPITLNFIGDLPPRLGAVVVGQMTRDDGELFYQITLENARLEARVTAELGWVYEEVMSIYEPCSSIPEATP